METDQTFAKCAYSPEMAPSDSVHSRNIGDDPSVMSGAVSLQCGQQAPLSSVQTGDTRVSAESEYGVNAGIDADDSCMYTAFCL